MGYDLAQELTETGLILRLTLYWHADQTPAHDYLFRAQIFNAAGQPVAIDNTFPQDGDYPATWWRPGQTVIQRYEFLLEQKPQTDVELRVGVHRTAALEAPFVPLTTLRPAGATLEDLTCP